MRHIQITVPVIFGLLLVLATYRQESSFRHHLDTLRQERRLVTRVFGIPIMWRERTAKDHYSGLYSQITGKEPDPTQWRQMPPDCIESLWSITYRCGGPGFVLQERFDLLEAAYERFRLGGLREAAAAQLKRIDELTPTSTPSRHELDLYAIDALRIELGLKPRLKP